MLKDSYKKLFQNFFNKLFSKSPPEVLAEKNPKDKSYLCPFCFEQLGPTQDCFSCGAKSLNQMFWIDNFPTMSNSSVDTMDLVLWKNSNTEIPHGVAKMCIKDDTPAYFYSEDARRLHDDFRIESEKSHNQVSSS